MEQETSKEAYRQVQADGTESKHEQKILEALSKLKNGGTFLDIAGMTDIAYLQVARRCAKLVNEGKIKDSGLTSKSSPSRKKCIVWSLGRNEQQIIIPPTQHHKAQFTQSTLFY